jgi:glucokinase
LTFGTGIGGATVLDGRLYRGGNGEHPEPGHVPVSPDGPPCYCARRGCLESLASGSAIGAAGREIGLPDAASVFAAAAAGNTAARSIVERVQNAVAVAAWTLCHTLLPERLVLGGGIMNRHFALFAPAVRAELHPATQIDGQAVTIVPAQLGSDAGLIGAASLVLEPRTRELLPHAGRLYP